MPQPFPLPNSCSQDTHTTRTGPTDDFKHTYKAQSPSAGWHSPVTDFHQYPVKHSASQQEQMLQQPLSHGHTKALLKVSFIHSLYPKSNFHFLQGTHICSGARKVGAGTFEHSPTFALPSLPSSVLLAAEPGDPLPSPPLSDHPGAPRPLAPWHSCTSCSSEGPPRPAHPRPASSSEAPDLPGDRREHSPACSPQVMSAGLAPPVKRATDSDKAEASASAETDGICPRKLLIQHGSMDENIFTLLEHIPAIQCHVHLPARSRWLPSSKGKNNRFYL